MIAKSLRHWQNSFKGIPKGVWILSWVSLINRIGGMVIAFISLYLIQNQGFSLEQAGWAMSCFGIGAIGGGYFGGWLTDRFGYLKIQFWSLVLGGLALIGLMYVRGFLPICLAIGGMAFVGEIFRPANSVAIVAHSTAENRTRSFSLMRMSFNIGWTIAPAIGGVLVATWGWSSLFWIDGLTCIAAAILLIFSLKEQKIERSASTEVEAPIENIQPLRDSNFKIFWLLTLFSAIIFMQLLWTIPPFFKEIYHWDEKTIGYVIALNGLIVALVEMPLIFSIEKQRHQLDWVRIGIVLYAVSYLAFIFLPAGQAMLAALLYIVGMSFGEIFVMPFSATWVTLRAGARAQGKYMGFYMIAYSVANILSPAIGMQVATRFGWNSLWLALVVMSGLAWLGFRRLENAETSVPAVPSVID